MQTTHRLPHYRLGRRLAASAAAGAAVVFPLATLEWWAGGSFPTGVPVALYATMWLLATAGCLLTWLATRGHGPDAADEPGRRGRWPALVGLLLVAGLWLSLVRDQWPCFRGLPNCD